MFDRVETVAYLVFFVATMTWWYRSFLRKRFPGLRWQTFVVALCFVLVAVTGGFIFLTRSPAYQCDLHTTSVLMRGKGVDGVMKKAFGLQDRDHLGAEAAKRLSRSCQYLLEYCASHESKDTDKAAVTCREVDARHNR